MLRDLGKEYSPERFEKEEDRQTAQILIVIILGAFVTCLVTVLSGFSTKDPSIILVGVFGLALLVISLPLYAREHLNASGFLTGFSILVIVTLAASKGQGIHDMAIMAYPVIILIASLIMNRLGIILLFLLSIVAIGWLVYGEASSLFIPLPLLRPTLPDFLIMAGVLILAVLIVHSQARIMRNNLKKAHQEIDRGKHMEEQLRFMGTHDILTGVYNRQFFDEELYRLEKSRSYPISVIVADLDNLKETNDTLGHNIGDELLKRTSVALRVAFRAGDILARIGGDEFAVLLPSTDEGSVQALLCRIQARIDQGNSTHPDLQVQLSFGAATAEKSDLPGAFSEADQRMYEAKSGHKAKDGATYAH
jgi:diguanylate cyclase (GGDEF)-like protein